jgi:thioredoxin-like negative regulator of GroEL
MPTIDDGRQAIEQGNPQQARLIFEAILQETPRSEEAWMGLAEVLTDTNDKRICYENVLKINKDNRQAREALRNLEPEANPLIAALGQQAVMEDEDEAEAEYEADTTVVSETYTPTDTTPQVDSDVGSGPPTPVLVAVGLLLSVVVFAIGGGAIFFVLTSIR